MANNNRQLEIRSVEQLKGRFRIPSYQRGYRWERRQVEQLLEDLLEHSKLKDPNIPYYLQPIVVAPASAEEREQLPADEQFDYDLIDGQQRLTTILLILKALDAVKNIPIKDALKLAEEDEKKQINLISLIHNLSGATTSVGYELMYQTRKDSRDFIRGIDKININIPNDVDSVREAPDHLYMWHAYNTIKAWIDSHSNDVRAVADVINNNVRVIWYELAESVPNWKKFKDLNDGKIALTNSELIKALVLRRNEKLDLPDYEQDVIVAQWDDIEHDLSDERFWRFLTTKPMTDYPTKIDLLFDLIAGKSPQEKKDEYFTFRFFNKFFDDKKAQGKTNKENWTYIHDRYRRIRDWYNDAWMYHRVGYLVAVGKESTLRDIYLETYPEGQSPLTHKQLREAITRRITDTLKFEQVKSFKELNYQKHSEEIIRVLTLYNVLLADELSERGLRYPFHIHNDDKGGGWSLEHVHAQNSEDLKGLTEWKTWVKDQLQSLRRIQPQLQANGSKYNKEKFDKLVKKMETFISASRPDENEYKDIVTDFAELTSIKEDGSEFDMHSIANLALLSRNDNSMLNKSTFDVKRMKIAQKSSTNFVPLGTERVFMKAIAGCTQDENGKSVQYACDTSQMFFWGDTDRKAYIRDIEETLKDYLPKEPTSKPEDNATAE